MLSSVKLQVWNYRHLSHKSLKNIKYPLLKSKSHIVVKTEIYFNSLIMIPTISLDTQRRFNVFMTSTCR